jgi:hypothetical protein
MIHGNMNVKYAKIVMNVYTNDDPIEVTRMSYT